MLSLFATTLACTYLFVSQAQTAHSFEAEIKVKVEGRYMLYLPDDYERSAQKYPLVLFLHGRGESGTNLDAVNVNGPGREIADGRKFPFIMISPQTLEQQFWDVHMLTALLNKIEKDYRVDKKREYVTGLSMGGHGTYALAAYQPTRFAAIAPVCGAGDLDIAPRLTHVPIFAVHGEKDDTVPCEKDQQLIDAIRRLGGDAKIEIVANAGHDVWTRTYAGNEIYDWLLSHKKS
jgi:predicted peptidase